MCSSFVLWNDEKRFSARIKFYHCFSFESSVVEHRGKGPRFVSKGFTYRIFFIRGGPNADSKGQEKGTYALSFFDEVGDLIPHAPWVGLLRVMGPSLRFPWLCKGIHPPTAPELGSWGSAAHMANICTQVSQEPNWVGVGDESYKI